MSPWAGGLRGWGDPQGPVVVRAVEGAPCASQLSAPDDPVEERVLARVGAESRFAGGPGGQLG